MLHILDLNQDLIQRFLDLATCVDVIPDSRHRWFYSMVNWDDLSSIQSKLSREDLQQDINVYIIHLLRNSKLSDESFSNTLKQGLGWYLRDHLLHLIAYNRVLTMYEPPPTEEIKTELNLDLRWIISDDKYEFSQYEKYLLYLRCYKCYTFVQISEIVYQERTTIRKVFKTITQKLQELEWQSSKNPSLTELKKIK